MKHATTTTTTTTDDRKARGNNADFTTKTTVNHTVDVGFGMKQAALSDYSMIPNRSLLHAELLTKVKLHVPSPGDKVDLNYNMKKPDNVVYSSFANLAVPPLRQAHLSLTEKELDSDTKPKTKCPAGNSPLSLVHKELLLKFRKSKVKAETDIPSTRKDVMTIHDKPDRLDVNPSKNVLISKVTTSNPLNYPCGMRLKSESMTNLHELKKLVNDELITRCGVKDMDGLGSKMEFHLPVSAGDKLEDNKNCCTGESVDEVFNSALEKCTNTSSTGSSKTVSPSTEKSLDHKTRNDTVEIADTPTVKPKPLPRTKHLAMKRRLSEQYSKTVPATEVKPRRQSESYSLHVSDELNQPFITGNNETISKCGTSVPVFSREISIEMIPADSPDRLDISSSSKYTSVLTDLEYKHSETSELPMFGSSSTLPGAASMTMEVQLSKGVTGLGFCIEGGKGSPLGDLPIKVKRVYKGGGAGVSVLKRGDEILKVNNIKVAGMNHFEAWNVLKSQPQGTINLLIHRVA